jgi:hypothetical protein
MPTVIPQIERLGMQHPELRQRVDALLAKGESDENILKEVKKCLKKKSGEKVDLPSIASYRKKWVADYQSIQDIKRNYLAVAEIIGERGLDFAAAAKLFEATQTMKPEHLLKIIQVGHERDKLKLAAQELQNRARDLEVKLQQAHSKRDRERREVKKAIQEARPEVVVQRIRGVFGLKPDPELLPAP